MVNPRNSNEKIYSWINHLQIMPFELLSAVYALPHIICFWSSGLLAGSQRVLSSPLRYYKGPSLNDLESDIQSILFSSVHLFHPSPQISFDFQNNTALTWHLGMWCGRVLAILVKSGEIKWMARKKKMKVLTPGRPKRRFERERRRCRSKSVNQVSPGMH